MIAEVPLYPIWDGLLFAAVLAVNAKAQYPYMKKLLSFAKK